MRRWHWASVAAVSLAAVVLAVFGAEAVAVTAVPRAWVRTPASPGPTGVLANWAPSGRAVRVGDARAAARAARAGLVDSPVALGQLARVAPAATTFTAVEAAAPAS